MIYLVYILIGLLAAVAMLMVYVRLAPLKAAEWHRPIYPMPQGEYVKADRFLAVRAAAEPMATLTQLDRIATATPRTVRLAGSIEGGRITYVTRSRVMRFPDITTVQVGPDDTLKGFGEQVMSIEGRLRFGKSDMGVNRARIEGWLRQLNEAQT